jgi:hypothetical protein
VRIVEFSPPMGRATNPTANVRREVGDQFLNGTHPAFTLYT